MSSFWMRARWTDMTGFLFPRKTFIFLNLAEKKNAPIIEKQWRAVHKKLKTQGTSCGRWWSRPQRQAKWVKKWRRQSLISGRWSFYFARRRTAVVETVPVLECSTHTRVHRVFMSLNKQENVMSIYICTFPPLECLSVFQCYISQKHNNTYDMYICIYTEFWPHLQKTSAIYFLTVLTYHLKMFLRKKSFFTYLAQIWPLTCVLPCVFLEQL